MWCVRYLFLGDLCVVLGCLSDVVCEHLCVLVLKSVSVVYAVRISR